VRNDPDGLVLRLAVEVFRERPITDGYRASLSFGQSRRSGEEAIVHDGVLVWESPEVARVWVLEPHYLPSFDTGRVLTLVEGGGARVVARARVLEKCVDPSASPLRDLRAAARRPLAGVRSTNPPRVAD
jgi:hypothetical protein